MAKTQTVTAPAVTVVPTVTVVPPVERTISVTPQILASILKDKGGASSFVSFLADYDMNAKGKMLKGKAGNRNPFLGKNLRKIAKTQATVNWASSQKKTEDRGGEFSGKGSWHTAVIIDGKPTPLSTHKADIKTDENGKAVLNENGNLIYVVDSPRFYLRYETVRAAGDGARADRTMRSDSHYEVDGVVVDKSEIEPWLPARSERKDETDIQVACLSNLTEIRIDGDAITIV